MGNETSVEDIPGVSLQMQDADSLWTIIYQEEGEEEEGAGEGQEVCLFTRVPGKGDQAELCRTGVNHLRVLRHPNILKFLRCDLSPDYIIMVTEPVVPLCRVLEGLCVEGMVIGWREIAQGLSFLHSKAGVSHNNLNSECVFVSTSHSQWKIGGFEGALQHKKVNAKFLTSISSIRHPKAIPPEDKASPASHGPAPCHARDIWAFGQLILTLLEDTGMESHINDSLFNYVQEELLNPDPELRPTAAEVLEQAWMSNKATGIADFLSKLTVKSKSEKDLFFSTLAFHLHSLPPLVVAEMLVPLILTPLVMAEPMAGEQLWKHLLTPVSRAKPRPKMFDSSQTCPLLDAEHYIAHVVPLLLNLLASREIHIRLVLLRHLGCFAPICQHEDLINTVLPEVLVGMTESNGEIVQATLHALAHLVPLLGAEAVMGTARSNSFTDAKPRVPTDGLPQSKGGPSPVGITTQPGASQASPSRNAARQERLERMREKREEQKRKREAQEKSRLGGKFTDVSLLDDGREESEGESGGESTSEHPQYSPSVSHDEDEQWEGLEGGETTPTHELPTYQKQKSKEGGISRSSSKGKADFSSSQAHRDDVEGKDAAAWEDDSWETNREEKSEEWGQGSQFGGSAGSSGGSVPSPSSVGTKGRWKRERRSTSEGAGKKSQPVSPTSKAVGRGDGSPLGKLRSKSQVSDPTKKSDSMRGRLTDEDIQRLEQQAAWTKEPDFFADMEPAISSSQEGSQKAASKPSSASSHSSSNNTASLLLYQPADQEEGDVWGEDDWNDF